jgi:hypothetical protein
MRRAAIPSSLFCWVRRRSIPRPIALLNRLASASFTVCGAVPSKSIVTPRTSEVLRTSATPSSMSAARQASTVSAGEPSLRARSLTHSGGRRFTTQGGGDAAAVGLIHFCVGTRRVCHVSEVAASECPLVSAW